MRYNVPQFIETEFKLIGFLTIKQFLICLAGGIFLVIIYSFTDLTLFIIIAVPTSLLTILFAFYRKNKIIPFHTFIFLLLRKAFQPKIRTWQREKEIVLEKIKKKKEKPEKEIPPFTKKISKESLSKLALTLNTGGRYKEEEYE